METHFIILSLIFGLIIGSFLTVCNYRLTLGRKKGLDSLSEPEEEPQYKPGEDQINLLKPARSFCPECKNQIKWIHNIPLFSWLFLKGRCAYCKTAIPASYPLIELITALSALACYINFGLTATSFLIFAFLCALIVISFIDIDYFIIPNVISLPGTALGLLVGLINQFSHTFTAPVVTNIIESVIGILAGGGVLYAIAGLYFLVRRQPGLGLGDVKLLMMTGAFFGWESSFYTMFVGSLLGAVFGVTGMVVYRHKVSKPMPFGPYLAIATTMYLFSGTSFLFWLRSSIESLISKIL